MTGYMSTGEHRAIVQQLAGMTATELGAEWTVDTSEEWADHRATYLDGPGGARLSITLDWRNSDRVEVAGVYPTAARDVYPYPDRCVIGVSRDRGPAVIAREITRRLLPKYLPEIERVAVGIDEHARDEQSRETFAAELAEMTGGSVRGNTVSFWTGGDTRGTYVDIRLNHDGTGGSVDRCGTLPADTVRALVRLLAGGAS